MERIIELIEADPLRLEILNTVASLNLPDCYVAAGFIRNLVWDTLHSYSRSAFNDIDVVFYSKNENAEMSALENLRAMKPEFNWQVKNQALMHVKNSDTLYINTAHAMEYWPELETAVGARMCTDQRIEILAPFGVETLFSGFITHNPNRSKSIFNERVKSKNWLVLWPKLKVNL